MSLIIDMSMCSFISRSLFYFPDYLVQGSIVTVSILSFDRLCFDVFESKILLENVEKVLESGHDIGISTEMPVLKLPEIVKTGDWNFFLGRKGATVH